MGSLAERLRDIDHPGCLAFHVMKAVDPSCKGTCVIGCKKCWQKAMNMLADAIETAEKDAYEAGSVKGYDDVLGRSTTEHGGVDVDALLKLADYFEMMGNECFVSKFVAASDFHGWKATIRTAVKGANASKSMPLPEGIEWPRFTDGELVKFGDVAKVREDIGEVIEVRFHTGKCSEVTIAFEGESTATHYMVVDGPYLKRPEPEVLDADGVPIKVGDTVYCLMRDGSYVSGEVEKVEKTMYGTTFVSYGEGFADYADKLTHRKPDTMADIESDAAKSPWEYYVDVLGENPSYLDSETMIERMCKDLLRRQRKLLGGK